MKYILYATLSFLALAACQSSRNYLSRIDEDRTLFDAVKDLSKHPADSDATKALPLLYSAAEKRHLIKISGYSNSSELTRWDKLIGEYNILQKMYDAISESNAAGNLIRPVNYQSTIYDLKQKAAEDFYGQAIYLLDKPGRDNAKYAYTYFKKADKWVPGYKDAKLKMNEAWQNAIVNVLINPVRDNSYFFNSGWGNTGYDYSNEYFQQTLVRDLGGKNGSRYAARFYSDWDARQANLQPDWVVDLTLRNLDIPRPFTTTNSRNYYKSIEVGRDTSGKSIYQNAYATVTTTQQSFTARAEMEVDITELASRRRISFKTFSDEYRWQEEHNSVTGDYRALERSDLYINDNRIFNEPRREDVLNELYKKIYPQVKNNIIYAVDW